MNAEELIIHQYELVKKKGVERKKASENYSKCLKVDDEGSNCLQCLIADIRNSENILEPEQFDNAVQLKCCKYCQAGWISSKSLKETKKKLTGLKHSMHALARRLLKEKSMPMGDKKTR